MLINIRGTNGSGKSTIIRELMDMYRATPIMSLPEALHRPKIIGYELTSAPRPLFVAGPYTTACGGCDAIKTQDEAKSLLRQFDKKGDVVFEGILISTIFGPWLEFSREMGGMAWAFLDTPLEVCLERIYARNGGKTINEQLVRDKFAMILRNHSKALAAGEMVYTIPYKAAVPSVLKILEDGRKYLKTNRK